MECMVKVGIVLCVVIFLEVFELFSLLCGYEEKLIEFVVEV